ncbi:tyrosine-type recombinase/integrase [Nocardia sp. NPDC058176]|uniref:tyrosine-type recombinase/integrase n=1 Tax=Nocardia sp. NPDC058176 TaxID=3346368 RepID=UPI0036DA6338
MVAPTDSVGGTTPCPESARRPRRRPTSTCGQCWNARRRSSATAHQLRQTAASIMIASGAYAKTIQPHLGHKSATMTLDNRSICSTAWPTGLARVSAMPLQGVPKTCPHGPIYGSPGAEKAPHLL